MKYEQRQIWLYSSICAELKETDSQVINSDTSGYRVGWTLMLLVSQAVPAIYLKHQYVIISLGDSAINNCSFNLSECQAKKMKTSLDSASFGCTWLCRGKAQARSGYPWIKFNSLLRVAPRVWHVFTQKSATDVNNILKIYIFKKTKTKIICSPAR